MGALFHIAKADGVIHPAELEYLEEVAAIFGFTGTMWDSLRAQYLGEENADPYVILGIERSVSDDELKDAYKRLIKEHHPDRLIAEGLPEEFIEVATEKLAAINTAYDRIKAERGMN